MLTISVLMTQFDALMFGAAIIAVQGPMTRLYAYPARTSTLVAWRLLPAMGLMTVEVLLSTMLLNYLFNVGWPLGGPPLFMAVAFAAIQAAIWLTEKSLWTVVALAAVGILLGPWFSARYSDAAFSNPEYLWMTVTSVELWTMLGFAVAAFGVTIAAVARNRRGESPLSIGVMDWCTCMLETAPGRCARFRSPEHAQFWFEWQRKGWMFPAVAVFGLVVGMTGWWITNRVPQDLMIGFARGGAMLALLGFLVGLILGHLGKGDSDATIGNFRATRPMTTTDMANTILYVAALSVLLAWAIWAVAFLFTYWLLGGGAAALDVDLSNVINAGYFVAILVASWIIVSCVASLGLSGYWKLFFQLVCGLVVGGVALSFGAKCLLPPDALRQFQTVVVAGAGVAFVLGTIWVFVEATRRSLVRRATCYGAAIAWVVGVTAMALYLRGITGEVPLNQYLLPAGILALAVAPLAGAPLALAFNRNR